MDLLLFTLLFSILGFVYCLSPIFTPRGGSPRVREATSADPFGDVVTEEAELEVAAGKLTEEELQHLQSLSGPPQAEPEVDIEEEIRARRRRLRQGR